MQITGQLTKVETNSFGYTSYSVGGKRYGGDVKGDAKAAVGDTVTFETFQKPGKDGKQWDTVKVATIAKVSAAAAPAPSRAAPSVVLQGAGSRDTYWADKAATDAAKEPRISYMAAYERAILFADLAIRNECFPLKAAKASAKLEVLESFVDEVTARIMRDAFAAEVPVQEPLAKLEKAPAKATTAPAAAQEELESDVAWE